MADRIIKVVAGRTIVVAGAELLNAVIGQATTQADRAVAAAELATLKADALPFVGNTPEDFVFALVDDVSKVGLGLRQDGTLVIPGVDTEAVATGSVTLPGGGLVGKAPDNFAWALLGEDDRAAGGVTAGGVLRWRAIQVDTINGIDFDAIVAGGGGGGTAARTTARIYDAEINLFMIYGQSLSMGGQSVPILSGAQRFDNLRFAGGTRTTADNPAPYASFVPLTEIISPLNAQLGETPQTGATDMVKELIFSEDRLTPADHAYQLLSSSPGQDGGSLEQQSIGSAAFNRLKSDIAAGYSLAQAAAKSFKVRAYGYAQGEGGGGSIGNTTAQFKAGLIKLRQDIDAEAKAVTGQAESVRALHYQTRRVPAIAQAHYEAARDDADIYLATPIYMLPLVADGTHLTPLGSKLLGAYMGIAYKRVVIDGELDWRPLVPIACEAQGRVATLRFHVPVGRLTVDTTLVEAKSNFGFTLVTAAGADIPVSGAAITGPDTIKLTTAAVLPAGAKVRYAWIGDGPPVGGNIRDQQGDEIVFDGGGVDYPMHNWCAVFEEVLN